MKALLKYSSRDNFVKYFQCITGISAEEIALRLNIEEERVEELRNRSFALSGHICTFRKLIAELRLEQFLYITNFCTGDALRLAWVKTTL